MENKVWKLCSLIITFCIIMDSSNGATNENLKKLAIANNDLGLKLYQIIVQGTSKNFFFSPFSISNAIGMLFVGAKKNTAKQLRTALGYDVAHLESKNVSSAFSQYLDVILPQYQSPNPEYILNLANGMLIAEDFIVYQSYKNELENHFRAFIEDVDFERNSAQLVDAVNDWVDKRTNGKIRELLSDLDPATKFLLLNAIYFKGTWKTKFEEKNTKYDYFYNYGSSSEGKEAPLMHLTSEFPYAYVGGYQALELPYKGDNISMIVLLPGENDGLTSLENSITAEEIVDLRKRMFKTKVIVTFPKFKIEYKRTMNPDFKTLGATDMFNGGVADFTNITPNDGIYVSEILHKAAVEVNEEGSEAAAATVIGVRATAAIANPPPTPTFTANRPFMFAIIDKMNDMMLFLGRVNEM